MSPAEVFYGIASCVAHCIGNNSIQQSDAVPLLLCRACITAILLSSYLPAMC